MSDYDDEERPPAVEQDAQAEAHADSSSHEDLADKLNNEGDIAADYLEELLDIADIDGDIDISSEADRATVSVVWEDEEPNKRLQRLIGKKGEVLEALQELTRLAVQNETGERSRLMLDVMNYRANRRAEISELARELGRQVQETGEEVTLDPMNPFERKVVHDVAAELGLASESEGMGKDRHVVLALPDDGDDAEDDEILDSDED